MFFKKKTGPASESGPGQAPWKRDLNRITGNPDAATLRSGAVLVAAEYRLRLLAAMIEFQDITRSLPFLSRDGLSAFARSSAPSTDPDMYSAFKDCLVPRITPPLIPARESHAEVAAVFQEIADEIAADDHVAALMCMLELEGRVSDLAFDISSMAAALLERNRNPWGALDEYFGPDAERYREETLGRSDLEDELRVFHGLHVIEERLRLCRFFCALTRASIGLIDAETDAAGAR